jgi:hypothetical protein
MKRWIDAIACRVIGHAAGSPVFDRIVSADGRHRKSLLSQQIVAAGGDAVMCEINTTPLVDILLVLIVMLIVSLPLMTHAVRIQMPQLVPHHSNLQREIIDLGIDFDGTVVWNGRAVASPRRLGAME